MASVIAIVLFATVQIVGTARADDDNARASIRPGYHLVWYTVPGTYIVYPWVFKGMGTIDLSTPG